MEWFLKFKKLLSFFDSNGLKAMFIKHVLTRTRLSLLDIYIVIMSSILTLTPFLRVVGFVYQTSRGGSKIDSGGNHFFEIHGKKVFQVVSLLKFTMGSKVLEILSW